MSQLPSFQQAQFTLANIIRTGEGRIEGVEPRRLKIYQELFFNNVEGFCATAFPVFKSIVGESYWRTLIAEFFVQHQCDTPHFVEISQEFLGYLAEHKQQDLPYPYLVELAHYEWVELASSVAENEGEEVNSDTSLLDTVLLVPESTHALSYQYPVHAISTDNQDKIEPELTCLLVYRDRDFNVQFVLTDQISVIALQMLQHSPGATAQAVIAELNKQNPSLSQESLSSHLNQALQHFVEIGAVKV